MENQIAVFVKYMGPTERLGARVKLTMPRFNRSLWLPYAYECRDAEDVAVKFLEKHNITPIARACGADVAAILLFPWQTSEILHSLMSR